MKLIANGLHASFHLWLLLLPNICGSQSGSLELLDTSGLVLLFNCC